MITWVREFFDDYGDFFREILAISLAAALSLAIVIGISVLTVRLLFR